MTKHRVYELAKEYSTASKVIIDILARHNIVAKNHMSSVDNAAKEVIAKTFARKTGTEEMGESKPAKAEPKEKEAKSEQPKNRLETEEQRRKPDTRPNQGVRQERTAPAVNQGQQGQRQPFRSDDRRPNPQQPRQDFGGQQNRNRRPGGQPQHQQQRPQQQ
ncbi:MAG: translation initiation factor IF-2 N-terminal domain-containing protein, partial [Sporomusaceae bacterium]|nr:translation initiation factor IF-2 N-terminal domain-containing protein [Sporomusaceae bacterium]